MYSLFLNCFQRTIPSFEYDPSSLYHLRSLPENTAQLQGRESLF